MLSDEERQGAARFLQDFQGDELLSLAETVTNRMVTVRSKNEAINAIILHSSSALELLRRRKVRKDHIFRHMANEKIPVSPAADKATLVKQLLLHWKTEVEEVQIEDDTSESPAKDRMPSQNFSSEHDPRRVQTLAEQFASWFYKQLNMLNQAITSGTPSDWGAHHFWENCRLNLKINSVSEQRTEEFVGAECVSQRFQSFVCDEGLIFNPNISPDGTQGLQNPHGLVMVRICGTIHQVSTCLGLFEQQFGLVRDPLKENNWKIKFIDMKMKQAAVERMPTLQDPAHTALAIK